jgi:hypothetical protein
MAFLPTIPVRADNGHGETALLFLFAASLAILFAFLLHEQRAEKLEPQRYTVVCGLRC